MAAAHAGVGYDRLLHATDRTEIVVQMMVVERVLDEQRQLEESRIERMANAIAKRL